MRVLVVLAHKANPRGKALGERFVKSVRAAFAACSTFQERLDVVVRTQAQLSEFIPAGCADDEVPNMTSVRDRLTCLDGVDFVFLDGDDNLLPWSKPAAPLLQLLHLCLTSGKCVLGCGCAVQLLAYLASVGPTQVPVLIDPSRVPLGERQRALKLVLSSGFVAYSATASAIPPTATRSPWTTPPRLARRRSSSATAIARSPRPPPPGCSAK